MSLRCWQFLGNMAIRVGVVVVVVFLFASERERKDAKGTHGRSTEWNVSRNGRHVCGLFTKENILIAAA